jgi:hypothetical protein
VKWEGALYPETSGVFANGESFTDSVTRTTNRVSLERLDTATVTFGDVYVYLDGVSNAERWNVGAQVSCVNAVENVHFVSLSVFARRSKTNGFCQENSSAPLRQRLQGMSNLSILPHREEER